MLQKKIRITISKQSLTLNDSNLLFAAFQLIRESRCLEIVRRQDLLVSYKLVNVLSIVHHDDSIRYRMAGGVDTFTQDITIFVFDVLQADGAKRGRRHD